MKTRDVAIRELPQNASILVGIRRSGKTFRVYQAIDELLASGVPLERILYLNVSVQPPCQFFCTWGLCFMTLPFPWQVLTESQYLKWRQMLAILEYPEGVRH